MFQSLRNIDLLDQVAHFVVGALIVACSLYFMHWAFGVLISTVIAITREMYQHPWRCHMGCRTDLLFWTLGSLTPVFVVAIW